MSAFFLDAEAGLPVSSLVLEDLVRRGLRNVRARPRTVRTVWTFLCHACLASLLILVDWAEAPAIAESAQVATTVVVAGDVGVKPTSNNPPEAKLRRTLLL